MRRMMEKREKWVKKWIVDNEGDLVKMEDMYGNVVVDDERKEDEMKRIEGRIRKNRV